MSREVEFSRDDPTRPLRVRIIKIRRLDWNAEEVYELAHPSGDQFLAKRWELMPPVSSERWAAVLRHVRIFLPSLSEDEVVIFQNVPELRSVPQVAHAHVFVRPTSEVSFTIARCAVLMHRGLLLSCLHFPHIFHHSSFPLFSPSSISSSSYNFLPGLSSLLFFPFRFLCLLHPTLRPCFLPYSSPMG